MMLAAFALITALALFGGRLRAPSRHRVSVQAKRTAEAYRELEAHLATLGTGLGIGA